MRLKRAAFRCNKLEMHHSSPTKSVNATVVSIRMDRGAKRYRLELIASLHFRRWLLQPGHDVPTLWFSIDGGLSDSPYWMVRRPGLLAINLEWNEEKS